MTNPTWMWDDCDEITTSFAKGVKMNDIYRIMEIVNQYESLDKSAFIEDLLYMMPEDLLDVILYRLMDEYPEGSQLENRITGRIL